MDSRHIFKKYWFVALVITLELVMVLCFSFCSKAATSAQSSYRLYDSLSVTSSALSGYLIPYYHNSYFYSPFNSWLAFRISQYEYVMIVKCSDEQYYHIFYNAAYQGSNMSLELDSSSSMPRIDSLGFLSVACGDESLIDSTKSLEYSSDREYGQNYVIYVLVIFCSVLFIFSIFRNRVNAFSDRSFR